MWGKQRREQGPCPAGVGPTWLAGRSGPNAVLEMPIWNQGSPFCRPSSVGLDAPEESSRPPAQISSSPRRWDGPPASVPQCPYPECPANSEALFTDLRGLAGMEGRSLREGTLGGHFPTFTRAMVPMGSRSKQ